MFALLLLIIEFLDEFVYGAREAAWPLLRDDLALTYAQVGLLLGLPSLVGSLVEPVLDILADVWKRRVLILGGGLCFALALWLTATSQTFGWLLMAFILFYPASGAFVSLSQATLMDTAPTRHEQNMARWTFAGSLGVVVGPLALSAAVALGWGWRGVFMGFGILTALLLITVWRFPFQNGAGEKEAEGDFAQGLRDAWRALKRGPVLRWLILLQFSDLVLDVFLGYLALYMVDVAGVDTARASIAVAVWSTAGLVGDFLLIPLLARVSGLAYLRVSAGLEFTLLIAFLLTPSWALKLLLLALLGLFNAGWYAILKAQLYSAMPGRSGTVLALYNIFGFTGSLLPWLLGWVAERAGLPIAMGLILLGPVALLLGLPKNNLSRDVTP